MVKKENLFKVVSGAMILTVVSVGGVALAGGKTKTPAKTTAKTSSQLKITKQFKDFGQPGMGFRKGPGGQVQEVSQKLAEEKQAKELAAALNKLVAKGTIAEDKAKEVQDYLAKLAAERKAEFEKINNMTPEEVAKYFATKKADTTLKAGPFGDLVSANILTQDQATALADQLMENKKAEMKQKLTDNLNALVAKGTITQDQATKVIAKLEAIEKEQQALMDKIKAMTPEERMNYMQENMQDKMKSAVNPIDQLVTEGVITADQAMAISSILPLQGPMGGKMMMPFGQSGPGGPQGPMGRGMMGPGGHMGPQGMFNKSL